MTKDQSWQDALLRSGFESKTDTPVSLRTTISAFLHRYHNQLTDIQAEAVQPIYKGENAILISGTASGKTEAAVIPIVARIIDRKKSSVCLYLAPTRALLNDLYRRLQAPLHQLGMQLAIRHGDRPLKSGDEGLSLLLTTPESLDVLLSKTHPCLAKVGFIVCDEIHQVLGTPRGSQLLFLIQRLKLLKPQCEVAPQRVALSATLGNPDEVSSWFCAGDRPAKVFSVGQQRPLAPEFRWIGSPSELRDVIRTSRAKKVLIFVNSRRVCDSLFLELQNLLPYRVFIHYSTLSKQQREYVESQFKLSEYSVCVATSTLELGIDIGSIEVIILYEPPNSVTNLLQRVGRGGRRVGETWAIMTPSTDLQLLSFCALTSLAQEGLVEAVPPGQFFSVVVQQIFSYIAGKRNYRMHEQEALDLCSSFSWIGQDDITLLLGQLCRLRYLRPETEWSSYQMGANLGPLFNDSAIHSNIADRGSGIQVLHEGRLLATLPLPASQIKLGAIMLYAGRFWKIVSVGDGRVTVRPNSPCDSPIRPRYGGRSGSPMSALVAQRIKSILYERKVIDGLEDTSAARMAGLISKVPAGLYGGEVLEYRHLTETGFDYYYYTFAGGLENSVLQLALSENGYQCQLMRNAEGIALHASMPLDFEAIPDNEDSIVGAVRNNWQRFRSLVNSGPFYELLPTALKKKEILSQVLYGPTVANVTRLKVARVVTIPARLF